MTDLMCDSNERVESKITPRLRTSGDGVMEQPSTWRRRSPILWSCTLGPITMISVFLLLSLRKLVVIQSLIAWRQSTMACGGSVVFGEVLRYSWVSSA